MNQVYVYSRIREQPHFRKFLWGSGLCYLLSDPSPDEDPYLTKRANLSRKIVRMIFTGFNKNCRVEVSFRFT